MKNIIVSSTQFPGYGGAATNAYSIIKYLRSRNLNAIGIFFNNDKDVNYDPENIGNIVLFTHKEANSERPKIKEIVYKTLGGKPDICFCKLSLAPILCKKIFECFTVYLVPGIPLMSHPFISKKKISGEQLFRNNNFRKLMEKPTKEMRWHEMSIEFCDLIINNSPLSNKYFKMMYPNVSAKIGPVIDTSKYMNIIPQKVTNTVREYDLIICSSILTRVEKNNFLLIDILDQPVFNKFKKIFVGADNNPFKSIPNSTFTDIVSPATVLQLLHKSRVYLCPSLFDSNPNTVREAQSVGCIPVISKNVGYNELYPKEFVCDSLNKDEWKDKILYILENYEEVNTFNINYPSYGIENIIEST